MIRLIVGLGNPGKNHARDRHNVGFWFIDALSKSLGVALSFDKRCNGETGVYSPSLRLLKPQTYMNASGEAVAACAKYFRISNSEILVVHDDLDLPVGSTRLKEGGGYGGHNGLKSIGLRLGSNQYLRVRLGIGHPGVGQDVTNYVLGKPARGEIDKINDGIKLLLEGYKLILQEEFSRAMNHFNQRYPKPNTLSKRDTNS